MFTSGRVKISGNLSSSVNINRVTWNNDVVTNFRHANAVGACNKSRGIFQRAWRDTNHLTCIIDAIPVTPADHVWVPDADIPHAYAVRTSNKSAWLPVRN